MFDVNFNDVAEKILPIHHRKSKVLALLRAILSPLKQLNIDLQQFRSQINYRLYFNAQIIYLEKYLNLEYDEINNGIYIEDVSNLEYVYWYNAIENQPAIYLYNNYSSGINYMIGEFCAVPIVGVGTQVYKCLQNCQNEYPPSSPLFWELHQENMYLFNQAEYNTNVDFIIKVPATVTFNEVLMRRQVDQYNQAGKKYLIQTYL